MENGHGVDRNVDSPAVFVGIDDVAGSVSAVVVDSGPSVTLVTDDAVDVVAESGADEHAEAMSTSARPSLVPLFVRVTATFPDL